MVIVLVYSDGDDGELTWQCVVMIIFVVTVKAVVCRDCGVVWLSFVMRILMCNDGDGAVEAVVMDMVYNGDDGAELLLCGIFDGDKEGFGP